MFRRTRDPHRISISLTRMGWVFVAVLLGMLWGSSNYNNNVGFIFVFILAGAAGGSAVLTWTNAKSVDIGPARARPVFAGEEAVFELDVSAARDVKSVYLLADRAKPSDEDTAYDVPAVRGARVRMAVAAPYRGWFKPGPVHVVTEYPLSLFRAHTLRDPGLACLVYPAPARRWDALPAASGGAGEGDAQGPGVEDFSEIRPYRRGDPPQRIAWKASTRGQGLFTKTFHGLRGASMILDYDAIVEGGVEHRLSLLTGMVLELDRQNVDFGLRIPGKEIPPPSVSGEERGGPHRRRCLEALALFGLDGPHAKRTHG
ncbi:MAG: DUF58 domain-containing protein [Oceanidesulfovibrio sp.]